MRIVDERYRTKPQRFAVVVSHDMIAVEWRYWAVEFTDPISRRLALAWWLSINRRVEKNSTK
jgi:hypothetical protein